VIVPVPPKNADELTRWKCVLADKTMSNQTFAPGRKYKVSFAYPMPNKLENSKTNCVNRRLMERKLLFSVQTDRHVGICTFATS
jgi:hypothetical protein